MDKEEIKSYVKEIVPKFVEEYLSDYCAKLKTDSSVSKSVEDAKNLGIISEDTSAKMFITNEDAAKIIDETRKYLENNILKENNLSSEKEE